MYRYFIELSYDGTDYSGWQRQKSTSNTIQQVLEDTFSKFFKSQIHIIGCGRTDEGVHASQYFAHFDVVNLVDPSTFIARINLNLPSSICIHRLIPVHEKAHARYDAISRKYDYYFHTQKSALVERYSTFYDIKVCLTTLESVTSLYKNTSDFYIMAKSPDKYPSTRCSIKNASVTQIAEGSFRFSIEGDRFLRSMIRLLVGRMIDVNNRKMTLETLQYHLEKKIIPPFHSLAYPQGLQLSKITYSYI